MSPFAYRGGELHAEGVALSRIAAAVGTPVYCYSAGAIRARYQAYADAFKGMNATICYALKANSNLAVIATLARLGAGADVVSEGELRRALAAGVPAGRIVFSGIGKSRAEMEFALDAGIMQINAESLPELAALSEIARRRGRRAKVALRVNPDVDARTHAKISTGLKENKFGIDIGHAEQAFDEARALAGIEVVGIAVHIGSQLTDLAPYRAAFTRIATLARALKAEGHGLRRIDLGGGLGIRYRDETPPSPADYAAMVRETVAPLGCELVFEPGRSIVGEAGLLLTRVLYVKQGVTRRFIIVDAAMNDLIRPALYDSHHAIEPVRAPEAGARLDPADIVGPVCESSDIFAAQRPVAPVEADELLVIRSAGAYGSVMASEYNTRPLVPEVLVDGDRFAVVRPRPSYDEMLAREVLPDWFGPAAAKPKRGAV